MKRVIRARYDAPYDLPIEPPESEEPIEHEVAAQNIYLEFETDVEIDKDKDFSFLDKNFTWAQGYNNNGGWNIENDEYTEDEFASYTDVVDALSDMLEDSDVLPENPGKYRINVRATLTWDIHGCVYLYTNDDVISDLDCHFNRDASYIDEISFTKIEENVQASTILTKRIVEKYNGVRYRIYYNDVDTSEEASPAQILEEFEATIEEIHPYDEGDYLFAKLSNGVMQIVNKDGQIVDTSFYFTSDDMDVENTEWCNAIIELAIEILNTANKDVEPKIVHN